MVRVRVRVRARLRVRLRVRVRVRVRARLDTCVTLRLGELTKPPRLPHALGALELEGELAEQRLRVRLAFGHGENQQTLRLPNLVGPTHVVA